MTIYISTIATSCGSQTNGNNFEWIIKVGANDDPLFINLEMNKRKCFICKFELKLRYNIKYTLEKTFKAFYPISKLIGSNSVLYMYKIMSWYIRSVFPSSAEKAREGATDITRNLFGEEPLDMPRGEITHFLQNESSNIFKCMQTFEHQKRLMQTIYFN